jgi:protein-S-isoprenylcysteine O-methyltransferase Ste14
MTTNQRSPIDTVLCAIGAFFFRFRNGLFPAIFLLVVLLVRPSFFAGEKELDPFATGFGVAMALLGEIVRCLTIGLVYVKRGGLNRRVYAKNLVTEGIYAHTRNPMYTGNLLIALGFCLMYGSPWMCGVVFPFFLLVYVGIVFEEERFLREKFGTKYEEYCRNTNRFLPRVRGLAQTMKQHHFDWKKVVKKEFGTIFGSLFGAYVVLTFKYLYLFGPVGILGHPVLLSLFSIPLFILYGTARFLKKTKRL